MQVGSKISLWTKKMVQRLQRFLPTETFTRDFINQKFFQDSHKNLESTFINKHRFVLLAFFFACKENFYLRM